MHRLGATPADQWGPGWLDSDLYDIEAKADYSYNIDDLHTMFQNLLPDEFKLVFHKEIKDGPVYALMVDKSGSRMKVNQSPRFRDSDQGPSGQSCWDSRADAVFLLVAGTDTATG